MCRYFAQKVISQPNPVPVTLTTSPNADEFLEDNHVLTVNFWLYTGTECALCTAKHKIISPHYEIKQNPSLHY